MSEENANIAEEELDNTAVRPKEASRLLGITQSTLRRWNNKGLIKAQRTMNNQRRYPMSEIRRLQKSGYYMDKYEGSTEKRENTEGITDFLKGVGMPVDNLEEAGKTLKTLLIANETPRKVRDPLLGREIIRSIKSIIIAAFVMGMFGILGWKLLEVI